MKCMCLRKKSEREQQKKNRRKKEERRKNIGISEYAVCRAAVECVGEFAECGIVVVYCMNCIFGASLKNLLKCHLFCWHLEFATNTRNKRVWRTLMCVYWILYRHIAQIIPTNSKETERMWGMLAGCENECKQMWNEREKNRNTKREWSQLILKTNRYKKIAHDTVSVYSV